MKMIAAVGRNYEIGIGNELPWRCPTDLKLFKQLTKNATVVMGTRRWKVSSARCQSAITSF